MKCPYCGHPSSKVIDSRTAEAGIRRRRRCEECDERFTTFEQIQRAVVMVVKKDGRREEFSREKLLSGLRIAARKRPLPTGAVEAIVEDIEQRLMGSSQGEVPSRVIDIVNNYCRQKSCLVDGREQLCNLLHDKTKFDWVYIDKTVKDDKEIGRAHV